MKKQHIRYIIGVMIFGLSGLIYLQFRWVQDSIIVKETRFDQTVHAALEKVAQKIQQAEFVKSLKKQPNPTTYTTPQTQVTHQSDHLTQQQTPYTKVSIQQGAATSASTSLPIKHPKAFLGIYFDPDSIAEGILLEDVVMASSADKAGLRPNDLIVRLNGNRANNNWILRKMIGETGVGQPLAIEFIRNDSLHHTTAILSLPFTQKRLPYLGAYITSLQTLKKQEPKIQVISVDKGSLGERIGLQQYDIIHEFNHKPLHKALDIITQLNQLSWQSPLQMLLEHKKQMEEICYSLALETIHLAPAAPTQASASIGIYGKDRIQGVDTLTGVSITKIVTNSEAHKIGLQKEDVIIRFNQHPVHNFNDFRRGLMDWQEHRQGYIDVLRSIQTQPLDTLRIYFHRWHSPTKTNSWKELQAKYRMPKYVDHLLNEKDPSNQALLGIEFIAAPDSLQKGNGVWVEQVLDNSPAKRVGLMKGDIIVAIDHQLTPHGDTLLNILKNYKPNQEILIDYIRPSPIKRHEDNLDLHATNFPKPLDTSALTQQHQTMLSKKMAEVIIQDGVDIPSNWTPQIRTQLMDRETMKEQVIAQLKENAENIFYEIAFIDKPIKERIAQQHLDTILTEVFQDAGIHTPYEYGLFSSNQQIIYNSEPAIPKPILMRYPYRKKVFDHSILSYPGELRVNFPQQSQFLWTSSFFHLFASLLFNIIIVGTFAYTIYIIIRQKKFSEMKTDFINNMTHELKTPISTIKLACEILKDKNLPKTEQRIARYAGIIDDENERLQSHVEKVLHFARLEKGNLKLNREKLNIQELVREAVQQISLQVQKREGTINYHLEALQPIVFGDKLHLTNVISNLLDNAIKYSQEAPEINVYTRNTSEGLQVAIQDKGIGMSKESVKHIFDKFYRVSTGNRHDVKGFGLGLSYVKLMVEAHHGSVSAKSKLKKGSTVAFTLPTVASIQ